MDPGWLWLKKPAPKWVALVSGNMDQNLRNPSCLILSHTQISKPLLIDMGGLFPGFTGGFRPLLEGTPPILINRGVY